MNTAFCALLLYMADFVTCYLFNGWILYGLLVYFFTLVLYGGEVRRFHIAWAMGLLLSQSVLIHGLVVPSFVLLLSLLAIALQARSALNPGYFFGYFWLFLALVADMQLVARLGMGQPMPMHSTLVIFCINLIVLTFMVRFKGLLGI